MEQLDKHIYTVRELGRWLQKEEKVVIYGIGDYGKQIVDYLFFIGEEKKIEGIVVTEKRNEENYKGIKIQASDDFFVKHVECTVIIAVSAVYQSDIEHMVLQYSSQYCCMTGELYHDIEKKMDPRPAVPFQGIDFLCPGFGKCGTTSLYSALRKVDSIYLPEQKENHFLQWCDDIENAKEILAERFYDDIKEGQKVGMIDPTYAWEAKKTYDALGGDIKIIFMVRNPVDAAFSGFKMAARQGRAELDAAYLKNGGKFSVEIFEEHFKKDKDRFMYIDWVRQFERYYTKENIKIIILEEFISSPQRIFDEVLEFIGIDGKYECEKLPLSNEGGYVMADLEGYQLAKLRLQENVADWNEQLRIGHRVRPAGTRVEIEEKYARASKLYNVKMSEKQRKNTEIYYNKSIRELETWMNKDLSLIWF